MIPYIFECKRTWVLELRLSMGFRILIKSGPITIFMDHKLWYYASDKAEVQPLNLSSQGEINEKM